MGTGARILKLEVHGAWKYQELPAADPLPLPCSSLLWRVPEEDTTRSATHPCAKAGQTPPRTIIVVAGPAQSCHLARVQRPILSPWARRRAPAPSK